MDRRRREASEERLLVRGAFVLPPNEVKLRVRGGLPRDGMDVRASEVRRPVSIKHNHTVSVYVGGMVESSGLSRKERQASGNSLDPPFRLGIDKLLLVAEDDDSALGDKEGQLRALAVSERGEVDARNDLRPKVGSEVTDLGILEERQRRRVVQSFVTGVDVLKGLEGREFERRSPLGEETAVLVILRSGLDSLGPLDFESRELLLDSLGRRRRRHKVRMVVKMKRQRRLGSTGAIDCLGCSAEPRSARQSGG